MTVTLTEKAAFRLRTFIRGGASDSTEVQKGVRLAVIDGGCNGYEYSMNITNTPSSEDLVFEQDKVPIYIDRNSVELLDGVVVDFVESLTQSGFTFKNPNASDTCGCGKSFASKADCSSKATPCS